MADLNKALTLVFGYAHQDTKYLKEIPIVMRTLYDTEIADALHRAEQHTSTEEKIHFLHRWRLAYSIISVNEIAFPPIEAIQERFDIVVGWLNYFVEKAYELFEELCDEEDDLTEIVKNSIGTEIAAPETITDSESIGE